MATVTKPEKKKSHVNAEKERAAGSATEVKKLDLDCGCFRYRTLNIKRGRMLKNLTLIDSQDIVKFGQEKKTVKGSGGGATAKDDPEMGGGGVILQTTSQYSQDVDKNYVDYTQQFSSDENADGCFIM